MNIIYECEVCGEQYTTPKEANSCETKTLGDTGYEVGDTVYIKQRYPTYANKPFVAVTITDKQVIKHDWRYELSSIIQTGKDWHVGAEIDSWDDAYWIPAYDSHFNNLGDIVRYEYFYGIKEDYHGETELTLDMVENNEGEEL